MKRSRYGAVTKRRTTLPKYNTVTVVRRRTPMYRPLTQSIYPFRRQIQQSMLVNQSAGYFGAGFDMCIAPAFGSCDFRINGVLIFAASLPNATEFTALFDQYRIRKINVRVIFSQNSADVNTSTVSLPVVHQMNDYNSTGNMNLSEYQQHPELKTWQLGQDKDISWSFVPHVRGDLITQGGVLSSSANNMPCPWIDTSSTSIEMLGTRLYLNNLGQNTNVNIGAIMFLVDYYMEFKFVK